MSIPRSGTLKRSIGVVSAISKQLRLVNLKAVKRMTISFDPFHENVKHTRNFLYFMSSPKIAQANPNFTIKTEIVCNRAEPKVTVKLLPDIAETFGSDTFIFKSDNLDCLELIQLVNKYITPLAPKEQVVAVVQTKSEKKSSRKR